MLSANQREERDTRTVPSHDLATFPHTLTGNFENFDSVQLEISVKSGFALRCQSHERLNMKYEQSEFLMGMTKRTGEGPNADNKI